MESKMEKITHIQQLKDDFKKKHLNQATDLKLVKQADSRQHLHKENLKKTDAEINKLIKVSEDLKVCKLKEKEQLEELNREITLLLQEVEIKDEERKLATECLASSKSDVDYIKQKIESVNTNSNGSLDELQKMDKLFQERLGLKFISTPDQELQIVFTNINPKDPMSVYSFNLKFVDGSYIVSNAQPDVEDLNTLTDKLNKTNDFRSFIISVRRCCHRKMGGRS